VRRFCLDCSKKSGRLVERVCAANERERETARARQSTKAAGARARERAKREAAKAVVDAHFRGVHPVTGKTVDLRRELPKIWKAARRVEPRLRERPPRLVRSTGWGSYAGTSYGEIRLGKGAGYETLVHEVAHFVDLVVERVAVNKRGRSVHGRSFYYAMKGLVERLVPGVSVSFYDVTAWGYNVDGIIWRQVREHVAKQREAA
jgi:hypothetical protein